MQGTRPGAACTDNHEGAKKGEDREDSRRPTKCVEVFLRNLRSLHVPRGYNARASVVKRFRRTEPGSAMHPLCYRAGTPMTFAFAPAGIV